jgi:hypothetical protein
VQRFDNDLHGHTFQVLGANGPAARKDTVLVPPLTTVNIDFDTNNPGNPVHGSTTATTPTTSGQAWPTSSTTRRRFHPRDFRFAFGGLCRLLVLQMAQPETPGLEFDLLDANETTSTFTPLDRVGCERNSHVTALAKLGS